MSFAEVGYAHQILRIDLDGESAQSITEILVPRTVELLRVPKRPAPLEEVLAALAALDCPALSDTQALPYLEVRVLLDGPEPGLRTRIEAALANKAVRLAKIETTSTPKAGGDAIPVSLDDLGRLRPEKIFQQLYQSKFGSEAPPEQLAAFAELLHAPGEKAA
jgi:exonuclease SbcD